MTVHALQVEIRPRTPGQTVALAARMLQHRPGPLLAAWCAATLPLLALAVALLSWAELHPAWIWAILLLAAPLFTLPMFGTVGMLVFSPSVTFGEVVVLVARRTIPFALLFVLGRLLTLAGLAALLVPGLYLWRNHWFLGPIVLLERTGLRASLRRARRFAMGYHGHVAAHAANTAAVLVYSTAAVGSIVHFGFVRAIGSSVTAVGELVRLEHYLHLLGLIGFCAAAPLAALIWFFAYLDVRTRKEGWDLEISFRERAAVLERARG